MLTNCGVYGGCYPSGFNSGIVWATKKVHSRTELPPDTDDPMVDGNGQKVQESKVLRASYKLTLLGTSQALTQNTLLEEEFVLMDDDVTTVVVEGVPSITGHFARLMVCVDLRKQLISKVRVNGRLQQVEYELLPDISFKCGHYGHGSESCMGIQSALLEKEAINFNQVVENIGLQKSVEEEPFVPSMVIGWWMRRGRFTEELRTMVRTTLMVARDLLRLERLREMNKILIQGTKNQAKENRIRQQVKGKGLLIGIGAKDISKALRPNNGKMRVRVKKINRKFDDVLKMGPKEVEGYKGNFMIQPINVSLNLNQEKHKALCDSVGLRVAMNGLVREFERVPKKAPMEDDTSSIKEVMVIEDACNDEVNV
ncbi:hypothetical protein Goklo_007745 [Gossypium klotzschianum]|uniref:DUF4283 domain-containing protein n=1 Tax=Gossypium klotzschianum TaxID=34286 RepID=A0A7J8UXU4_9ROSI|nr:hypothetical protein [Gossypium klotzschianum]